MRLFVLNVAIKLNNKKEVRNLIEKHKPDIMALQEVMNAVDDTCPEYLRVANDYETIFKYNHYAPLYIAKGVTINGKLDYDFEGRAEQGMMLGSNFKIESGQNLFYYNDYKYEYDATEFRTKEWCRSIQKVLLNVNGKKLLVINVHGLWNKDKVGDERTIEQSKFILKHIRYDIPCIVCGDLNLLPNTQSIKMIDEHLTDIIKVYNVKSTRPTFDDGLDRGDMVNDYIFVNDHIKVNNFKIIEKSYSDHMGLELDFDLV